jgi:mannose-6-phosphate isomerase-like protein (cupin superfamily)
MPRAGETIENPVTRERLRFVQTAADTGGELLEVEITFAIGGFVPAMHLHPAQEERFEVLAGNPRFRIGTEERAASPGEMLRIPPGVPHRFWNPGPAEARLRIQLRPALRMEEVLEETARLGRIGKLNRKGLPGPLRGAVLAREYAAEFEPAPDPNILLTRLPPRLLHLFLRPLGTLGRQLGYSPARPGH